MKMRFNSWKCTAVVLTMALGISTSFRAMAEFAIFMGVEFRYTIEGSDSAFLQGVRYNYNNYETPCIDDETIGEIIIPETIGGRKVVRLDQYAFNGCSKITSVVIPNTVTNISGSAFRGCTLLADVDLPDGLRYIDGGTFRGLGRLQDVVLPKKIEAIGSYAFASCSNLCNIVITPNVTGVWARAFENCSSLTNVVFGESLTSIGDYAFSGCSRLSQIKLPQGVASIGDYAFSGCSRLSQIKLPQGVASIGDYAFQKCGSVESLAVFEGLNEIGNHAFHGMGKVTEIDIPGSVTNIGMKLSPFRGWTSLESAAWKVSNQEWTPKNLFPDSLKTLKSVVIKEGTRTIPPDMFVGCEALESVVIPASVTRIGTNAFYDCSSLKQITFKGDAPYIEENAFLGTPRRMVVSVPVNSIGWNDDASAATLPGAWQGHPILHSGDVWNGSESSGFVNEVVSKLDVTVTNVVVHYIKTSAFANVVMPVTQDTGLVAVITEVKGGNFAVPDSWADNYPGFTEKFGQDFAAAMAKPTGKIDSSGNPLLVWHDYVCGTDPTDETDVFRASITLVDGKPVVSYTPELSSGQAALRKYTFWGKTSLADTEWIEIAEGETSGYNFFKVTVEMR